MSTDRQTVIVTGASQGIGAAVATLFHRHGWDVVAGSRRITQQHDPGLPEELVLVDGDVADPATAERLVRTALDRTGRLDAVVNNAGTFIPKPFADSTVEDFRAMARTNLEGFLQLTQAAVGPMLSAGRGGSVVTISASVADHPILTMPTSVAMLTKGGLDAASRGLALEHAAAGVRFNVVAPGAVATPLLAGVPEDALRAMSPMGQVGQPEDVAEAVLYLTGARQVTGEVLHVDGGMHVGHW